VEQDGIVRVVLVTVPDEKEGMRISRVLVEERLAACVNLLGGVRSVFHWDGRLCDEREALLVIKTTEHRLSSLISRIQEIHPYEVPEVLALPVIQGSRAYLDWVDTETRPERGSEEL
jgi:periplasmic divalent cation tolerance protein